MSEHESESHSVAAVLESMTLLATLSTAAEVSQSVAERRAGHDPSEQESSWVAAPKLRRAGNDVQEIVMQLMLSHVNIEHAHEGHLAAVVRHFDERMKLRRVARLLHTMHQRLLSLYPDVSEELVEEARITLSTAERLLDSDVAAFSDELNAFLERALGFVTWTRHEVA